MYSCGIVWYSVVLLMFVSSVLLSRLVCLSLLYIYTIIYIHTHIHLYKTGLYYRQAKRIRTTGIHCGTRSPLIIPSQTHTHFTLFCLKPPFSVFFPSQIYLFLTIFSQMTLLFNQVQDFSVTQGYYLFHQPPVQRYV